jgi:hydroxyacyl-ACP dehydratase HTD2-like protein with hotdog domain
MAIDVDKVYVRSRDAPGELTHFLKSHPADLVVIGNDGHSNKSSWLHPSATRRSLWLSGRFGALPALAATSGLDTGTAFPI